MGGGALGGVQRRVVRRLHGRWQTTTGRLRIAAPSSRSSRLARRREAVLAFARGSSPSAAWATSTARKRSVRLPISPTVFVSSYLLSKLTEIKANWRRGPAINRKLVNYDARRGYVLRFDDFEGIAASASPSILAPATIDMVKFRTQVQDDEFKSAWPATLTAAVPGLIPRARGGAAAYRQGECAAGSRGLVWYGVDALHPPQVPIYRRMIPIVYSLTPSLDFSTSTAAAASSPGTRPLAP